MKDEERKMVTTSIITYPTCLLLSYNGAESTKD